MIEGNPDSEGARVVTDKEKWKRPSPLLYVPLDLRLTKNLCPRPSKHVLIESCRDLSCKTYRTHYDYSG